jgi:hypothetical protein
MTPLRKDYRFSSGFRRFFFPGAFRRFGDKTLFERAGRDADVTDFAAGQERLHALQIHMELALGDGGNVRANAAGFLGFAGAPDNAALHRAFAGQFTNACHKILSLRASEGSNESARDKFFFGKYCVLQIEIVRNFAAHFVWPH